MGVLTNQSKSATPNLAARTGSVKPVSLHGMTEVDFDNSYVGFHVGTTPPTAVPSSIEAATPRFMLGVVIDFVCAGFVIPPVN